MILPHARAAAAFFNHPWAEADASHLSSAAKGRTYFSQPPVSLWSWRCRPSVSKRERDGEGQGRAETQVEGGRQDVAAPFDEERGNQWQASGGRCLTFHLAV